MPAAVSRPDPGGRGPAVSAHRGGSETAAEGTAEAYRSALAAGTDYLELDVRRTADGTLVTAHAARFRSGKPGLTRLTGGRGRAVADLSYPELCHLTGYQVARTAEVLGLAAAAGAGAHLDLKDPAAADQLIVEALSVLDPDRIILTTRDQDALRRLRHRSPAVGAGRTIGGDFGEFAHYAVRRAARRLRTRLDDVTAAGATWAVLHHATASPGLLAQCRELGLKTMIWTVNADDDLQRLLASQLVDVLVTDRPAYAIALRAELAGGRG